MINRARSLAVTVGLAIAASLTAVAIPAASQAAPQPASQAAEPDSVWDEAAASAAARQRGVRVEVASKTSETTQVFANADGSFTFEQSPTPQRARTSSGDWAHIDTTLQIASDGSLQPRNTVQQVSLSRGGSGPFATIRDSDRSLAVSWPLGELPTPVVEGSSATYPAVLPGVDLVATATPTGFTHVLVVKTRDAAANPQLKKIAFGLRTDSVTVQRTDVGGMQASDSEGKRVFTSPTPMMWDSSDTGGLSRAVATAEMPQQAAMDLAVADDAVTVTPDQQMLSNPDTVYPVFIDPAWSGGKVSNSWTTIWSQFPGESFWQRTNTEDGYGDATGKGAAKVGNFGPSTVRTLFKMDLSQVSGKQILDAKFRIHQKWSWNCSSSYGAAKIWLTIAPDPSTTWNNNVFWHEGLTADGYAPYGQSCGGGEGDVEFNATPIVQNEAAFRNDFGLGMRAVNESDNNYWKRYDHDSARIVVTYNTVPTTPTDPRADDHPAGSPRPVVGSLTPTLQAKVHDADGDTNLRNTFSWDKRNADGTWSNVGSGAQNNLRDGDTAIHAVTPSLEDKGIYRFRAQTSDAYSTGPASEFVEFEVDNNPPTIAPTVSSSDYGSDLSQIYGSIGKTGDFTFAAGGDNDIVGYRWGWTELTTNSVAAPTPGAPVTLSITPPAPNPARPNLGGLLKLHVKGYDASASTGPMTEYSFKVGGSSAPTAEWKLDEPAGSAKAADGSGNGHDATINGAIAGAPGRIPGASTSVAFDGVGASLSTMAPVLDTSKSFSVSAWVRLDSTSEWKTAITQEGNRASALFLQYHKGADRWAFGLHGSDVDSPSASVVTSTQPPKVGVWTHLAGVYDAGAGQLALYVNGEQAGTSKVQPSWKAEGPLTIGRAKYAGAATNFWHGAISDIKVWDRVVSGAEILPMSSPASAQWNLDGEGSDALSLGHDANPSDGVSWAEDRASNPDSAASLNGTSGWLETSGPVVRTDQSFEVTAWAKLTETGGGRVQTIASQDAAHTAGFTLGYDGGRNKWMFSIAGADSATAPATVEVFSDLPATAGQWVHLVGRYDALSDGLLLFVNGQPQTSTTAKSAGVNAQGAFAIGRRKQADIANSDLFRGDIDDVRAFAGLIADKSGANIVLRAPAAASSTAPPEWGWTLDKVNDGVRGPRGWSSWSSTDTDHQEWVAIKLPGKQAINRVDLYAQSDGAQTGAHFPANFTIEVWKGSTWLPVLSRTNYPKPTDGSAHSFTFDTTVTDEILIRGTNLRQMIFAEVEVFRALHRDASGSTTTGNLAFGANVSASSSAPTDWGWSTAYVNDARRDRGWSSWSSTDVDHTEWIELALPSATEINRMDLHPRTDGQYTGDNFPANFTIEAWDGSKWVTVVSRTNHPKPTDGAGQIFTFDPRTTSKIRVVGTGLRVMQFSEIEIYGTHQ